MRIFTFLFLIFCLISCKDQQLQSATFDEIIHYKLDTLAVNEMDISDILSGEAIQNISDTLIIDRLTEFGFVRSEVGKSDYIRLHQVLTSNQNTIDNTKCLPIYRDFLILKMKNRTVGMF